PDGTRIAFTSSRDGDPGVYVMSADGSDQRRLTAWRGREEAGGWSPDGARLLLASARGQPTGPDLWMVNADGTCPTPLTRGGVAAGPAAWSPAAPPPGPLRCGPGDPPAPEPPAIAVPHFDRAGSSADPQGLRASGVRTWWLGERHGGLVLVRIHRIP